MVDVVDLLNACLFIQDNLDADLSLMFLAQTVGLSRFRFHRVFKAWRGETLHDFVTRMRMEKAAFELSYPMPRSNRRSVKAIAFASGYKSLSSFSHAFSSYAHLSPRQFRYRMLRDRAQFSRRAHLAALAGARPFSPPPRADFAPFSISTMEMAEREVVIVDSRAPGFHRAQTLSSLATLKVPMYTIDSLPGLYAKAQRRQPSGAKSPNLSCIAVDKAVWERAVTSGMADPRVVRCVPHVLKAGRYAVIEGEASVAQLYKVVRRQFDDWLLANAECPRPEKVFVTFSQGVPSGAFQPIRIVLHVPLERVAERSGLRRVFAGRTASGTAN
jgi:AraC-like DNA-binding protein